MSSAADAIAGAPKMLSVDFGNVLLPAAAGNSVRMLPVRVTSVLDQDSVERNAAGEVTAAYLQFLATYQGRHWNEAAWGHPFGGMGIEQALNQMLRTRGYEGEVAWSTLERQDTGLLDFSADLALVDQLWPELAPSPSPSFR